MEIISVNPIPKEPGQQTKETITDHLCRGKGTFTAEYILVRKHYAKAVQHGRTTRNQECDDDHKQRKWAGPACNVVWIAVQQKVS